MRMFWTLIFAVSVEALAECGFVRPTNIQAVLSNPLIFSDPDPIFLVFPDSEATLNQGQITNKKIQILSVCTEYSFVRIFKIFEGNMFGITDDFDILHMKLLVLRTGMFIPDPGSELSIPDPGSAAKKLSISTQKIGSEL
jgi:hypothetical protein